MDTLFVRELKVETRIGIYDWERQVKQTILIDLDVAADAAFAARSDKVESTVNYQTICQRLVAHVQDAEVELVETLAEQMAAIVLGEFHAPWVRVTVHKPAAVRGTRDVGVQIERGVRPA
ncbi:dihydroneopterin aldolase [Acidithiobacillus sulfuriphilus]|uniref:dihydroneopterin aldolase n=1 Tax=Acidithiobacillus sulfuriphilus TaxID=1867749 RepID=UPI003F628AE2